VTAPSVLLPGPDRTLDRFVPGGRAIPAEPGPPPVTRRALAAAHVVADPLADADPVAGARLDWDATLAYRRWLWSLGLGVAEAMDTAQRGTGLGWPLARELIRRSAAEAAACSGWVACGAGTDQLPPGRPASLDAVEVAYAEQCELVEAAGGQIVLMASRALAECARGPDDYARVYARVLSQVGQPVILHWLGEAFDPQLAGYWGARDPEPAMAACLDVIKAHAHRVDGVKLSLLDRDLEVEMRRRLPAGVRMYTGDDFNYPELIRGDGDQHSDALLGIFDPIAPAAAAALRALDAGDLERYEALLGPTLPLARHCFAAPTWAYKTGVVLLAWLNGHQTHFRMVGGAESARGMLHLAELFRLADAAGLLRDPELACARMRLLLAVAGIEDQRPPPGRRPRPGAP
jgi:hypothetical protein